MNKKPNIVIFNVDSYRGDVLGHLGNKGAITPNLDAIIENGGVSYTNAFAQNPVCTPSRCSFMTGWYPHTCGHRSMRNLLKEHETDLLSVLRREGYHIWWGGKNDLYAAEDKIDFLKRCDVKYEPQPFGKGFSIREPLAEGDTRKNVFYRGVSTCQDDSSEPYYGKDHAITKAAAEYIANHNEEKPLCTFLTLELPHPAYVVEDVFYNQINPENLPSRLPPQENDFYALDDLRKSYECDKITDKDWKEIKRVYYAMCTKIDYFFGLLVGAMKNKGIYDDTLIIFMSDHGDFTGDYSLPEKTHFSLQDCLIRVPFIIKPPVEFNTKPGIRTHLTELVDMPATIYDMLGIEPGYDHYGKSLCNSLKGCNDEIRSAVFSEVGSRCTDTSFINKQILAPSYKGSPYQLQAKATWPLAKKGSYAVTIRTQDYKYIRRGYVEHNELYNLKNDPGELNNLSGSAEYVEIEQKMQIILLDHFMTTGDVLPHKQDNR